mmetsp:Transcript_9168/g.13819  ORF Transcript_9168/g.13819 Transcript_9168/m.13819 type:complete len:290 (-) Transcript_9168:576-1445(-)
MFSLHKLYLSFYFCLSLDILSKLHSVGSSNTLTVILGLDKCATAGSKGVAWCGIHHAKTGNLPFPSEKTLKCLALTTLHSSVVATISRSTHWTTGRIIHHHRSHPIVPLFRIVRAHRTIPRLGIPTHLHATPPAPAHALHTIGTPDVSRRVPHRLGQMSIVVPSPKFLVIDEALRDLVGGILPSPQSPPLVLGKVLPLIGIVVLDANGLARIQQLVRVHLRIGSERRTPLEMSVFLVAVLSLVASSVPIPPSVVVRPPPFAVAFAHAGYPVEAELEVVVYCSLKGTAVE